MPRSDELHSRLKASNSVASLRAELGLISIMRAHQWRCHHGAFYQDPVENKLREIDVLATQTWTRQTKRREETSYLQVIVEAKSAKDWQIVFSSDQSADDTCGYATRVWSGFIDADRYSWIRDPLLSIGATEKEIPLLIDEFEKQAFLNGMAIMPPNVEPPPASHIVTAFRETNIGNEKDLDNSVLWRAMSGLRSTTRALEIAIEKYHADWFGDPNMKKKTGQTFMEHFKYICDISLGRVDIYHPIIVIDSSLWLVDAQSLSPISSCRFHQLDHTGSVTWWCDVVQSTEFATHVDSLSRHYAKAFKRSRSKLS